VSVQGGNPVAEHPGGYKRTYDRSTGVWWWTRGGTKVAQDTRISEVYKRSYERCISASNT
jgi:hypothetical protein